jgi:hypothetical protein
MVCEGVPLGEVAGHLGVDEDELLDILQRRCTLSSLSFQDPASPQQHTARARDCQ